MKLITIVNDLQNKFEELESKTNGIDVQNEDTKESFYKMEKKLETVHSSDIVPVLSSNNNDARADIVNSKNVKLMENKITKLEQNAANRYFVIQGEKVADLIEGEASVDLNFKIRNKLKNILDEESHSIIGEILLTKVFGRNKDRPILKLEVPSSTIKSLIIAALKWKRPNGLYVSEFFVPNRLKLFHDVRIYAKDNVDQIDKVFTRGGVIFLEI